MSFLASLAADILEWLFMKTAWGRIKQGVSDTVIERSSQADTAALEKAQTKEEQDAAIKKITDDTFPQS